MELGLVADGVNPWSDKDLPRCGIGDIVARRAMGKTSTQSPERSQDSGARSLKCVPSGRIGPGVLKM